MAIKAKKHPRESSQGLIQRFSQKVKKSGVLFEAKRRRFKKRPKSHELRKVSALRRIEKKKERDLLKNLEIRQ